MTLIGKGWLAGPHGSFKAAWFHPVYGFITAVDPSVFLV